MRTLTGRERRTSMLGLCVAIPWLGFVGSRPYRAALSESREQLATQRDTPRRIEGGGQPAFLVTR